MPAGAVVAAGGVKKTLAVIETVSGLVPTAVVVAPGVIENAVTSNARGSFSRDAKNDSMFG